MIVDNFRFGNATHSPPPKLGIIPLNDVFCDKYNVFLEPNMMKMVDLLSLFLSTC